MKIGIALSSFEKSKQLFKKVEGILKDLNIDFKVEHNSDSYILWNKYFRLDAFFPSERICGLRFDHIITDQGLPEEKFRTMILPMLCARHISSGVTMLTEDYKISL